MGQAKTPDALRNACDQFFEWTKEPEQLKEADQTETNQSATATSIEAKPAATTPVIKRRPRFVVEAVKLLAASTPDGKVTLNALGTYLKRADSAFSPNVYGHSGLLNMLKTYDLLTVNQEESGIWTTSLAVNSDQQTDRT